jgi:hypothetical protein
MPLLVVKPGAVIFHARDLQKTAGNCGNVAEVAG